MQHPSSQLRGLRRPLTNHRQRIPNQQFPIVPDTNSIR